MKIDGSWKQGSDEGWRIKELREAGVGGGGTKDRERLKILNHGRHEISVEQARWVSHRCWPGVRAPLTR